MRAVIQALSLCFLLLFRKYLKAKDCVLLIFVSPSAGTMEWHIIGVQ